MIWSVAHRYVSLLFHLVRNERHLAIENPHRETFVRQLQTLLDRRVKQFMCQMKMTMSAAGFPRHIHRYKHSHAGCGVDEIPQSIFDKTQLAYMVLRAFTGDFLDFCLTYFV